VGYGEEYLVNPAMQSARATGFTLVELVVTMVLIGILAAIAVPQLTGTQVYDQLGFTDRTLSLLQYAQKTAIAERRQVCVTFSATGATLTFSSAFSPPACDTNVVGPGGENPYAVAATGLAAYAPAPANFTFNALGQASAGQTITFAGVGLVRTITVEQDTGYVHYN
jgi:MSHA pilin protein MshC